MQPVLERGSIDNPLTFDVGLIQLSFIPVCSPKHATFQSNCAEGLHFSTFHSYRKSGRSTFNFMYSFYLQSLFGHIIICPYLHKSAIRPKSWNQFSPHIFAVKYALFLPNFFRFFPLPVRSYDMYDITNVKAKSQEWAE